MQYREPRAAMQYRDPRAAEARRLRIDEGLSSKEIQSRLDVEKNRLQYWLAGLPTSQGLRPQARDDLKAKAREMRAEGKTYGAIVKALGVSQSSVSLWVRDIPVDEPEVPSSWTPAARNRRAEGIERRRAAERAERLSEQQDHLERLAPFDFRDLEIAAVLTYWCEGAKAKPWALRTPRVSIINSDPALLRLFLRYIEQVPVEHGGPGFRLHIHQSASEGPAKRYWARELGVDPGCFLKTVWKRHNPKTVRKNVGDSYHGCLNVEVRRSSKLYWRIEDVAKAVLGGMAVANADRGDVS